MNELHAPLARAIRDRVQLRYGPDAQEILSRGGTLPLNGGEADDAAQAALGWLTANGYVILPKASVETVLLDHAHQLEGEEVDANLTELAHVYEQLTGWSALREIAEDQARLNEEAL